jgi:hypothetical protein
MIEMMFWIWGMVALLSGRLQVGGELSFSGARARLIGLSFMLPLPLSLFGAPTLRRWVSSSEIGFFLPWMTVLLVLVFVGGGLLLGWLSQRPKA